MIDQEAYALVAEILKPESFYDKRNQLIYKAIQEFLTHLKNKKHLIQVLKTCYQVLFKIAQFF